MYNAISSQGCAHATRTPRGAWGHLASSVNRGLPRSTKRFSRDLATDTAPPGNPGS
jgi:hypothetical protein